MSITLMALAFELSMSAREKLLLLSLADHANDEGHNIFPSVRRLARKTSMSERGVQRGLRLFQAQGWLSEVRPATYNTPTRYRLNVGALQRLLRDDRVTPGDAVSGDDEPSPGDNGRPRGVTTAAVGVTCATPGGDTVSPNPSVEPPVLQPPAEEPSPRARRPQRRPAVPGVEPASFQRFYDAYPRREARKDALRAWLTLTPDDALVERIMAALTVHTTGPAWQRSLRENHGKFIPLPATWLNGRRWEDESTNGARTHAASVVATLERAEELINR